MKQNSTLFLLSLLFASIGTKGQYACDLPATAAKDGEEDDFNAYVLDFEQQGLHLNADVHCLPVVFHIINSPAFPISRAVDQLERTNEHLRRTHVDTIHTRDLFIPYATDSHIELRLASIDPQGTPFSGIHHIDVPGYQLDMTSAVIGANMFDHTRYLNVWVFPGISASGVFPWEADAMHDGIIVAPENVGYQLGGNDPDMQGGKVFTHEIGHYLGLYHPFHGNAWTDPGNCSESNCQVGGDRCCDTPIDYRMFPLPGDNCTMDTLWCIQGENVIPNDENFMFYNLDRCQNMFSYDQRTRMRACLADLRASLVSDGTHAMTGIECQAPVGMDRKYGTVINIRPNPVMDRVFIDGLVEAADLMIIDGTGRMVKQQRVMQGEAIDVSGLSPGAYQLRLLVDGEVVHRKVVKD